MTGFTTAAIVAGSIFAALVALAIVADAWVKVSQARCLDDPAGDYCRAELEAAVAAAIARADVFHVRRGGVLPDELREHVAAGVLEDLEAGNLAHAGMEALR